VTSIRERSGASATAIDSVSPRRESAPGRELVEHERRILDEDAVEKAGIRGQRDHAVAEGFEDLFVGAMLGLGARKVDPLAIRRLPAWG
jgi:hypothetical protein